MMKRISASMFYRFRSIFETRFGPSWEGKPTKNRPKKASKLWCKEEGVLASILDPRGYQTQSSMERKEWGRNQSFTKHSQQKHQSYKEDLNQSNSSIASGDSETIERIQMAEKIVDIEKQSKILFAEPPIKFKFDFEDYNNCKLNCKIKKLIGILNIKIPIIHLDG